MPKLKISNKTYTIISTWRSERRKRIKLNQTRLLCRKPLFS